MQDEHPAIIDSAEPPDGPGRAYAPGAIGDRLPGRARGLREGQEYEFLILGDMNIESAQELAAGTPADFVSLNDECRATNTNVNGPRPYDHVMFDPLRTTEIDAAFDLEVVNLIDMMQSSWQESHSEAFPGAPYDHDEFRKHYSDHDPVVFRLTRPAMDDD